MGIVGRLNFFERSSTIVSRWLFLVLNDIEAGGINDRLALALAMVSAWLLAAPAGVPTAQAQVNVNINIGKVASPVVKAGGSSNGAVSQCACPQLPGENIRLFRAKAR